MPHVSVIIPVYNRGTVVARAVRSVIAQTYRCFEIIVIDDGSVDETPRVINELAREDGRVRVIRHGSNCGAQAARNAGIRAARGEWIAFLDSDDQFLPWSLDARLTRANTEKVPVVHTDCLVIRDGVERVFGVPAMSGKVYREVLKRQGPLMPAMLVAKEALARVGYLDERIVAYQEWDTAIRLAKYYPFGFVPEPTFTYDCRGPDMMSKNLRNNAVGYEQVVRKHAFAILRHAGPRVLAHHYRDASVSYKAAGDHGSARRMMVKARLCWPFPL